MSINIRNWLFLFALIVAVLAADQISKRWIVDNLRVGQTVEPIPALSPLFRFTHSQNTGAALGFLPQAGDLFLVIAFIVVLGMLYFYPRIPPEAHISRIATGLISGGALGNAIDRLTYGHVVDFIHYQIPNLISNVSNIADHAIVLGVILIFIESWRSERAEARAKASQNSTTMQVEESPPQP